MKKLMKLLGIICMAVSANFAFAAGELDGHWQLKDRLCSSGVVPRDNFRLDRDFTTIEFSRNSYDGHSRINNCHYWITGQFETRGNTLRVYDLVGGSNCSTRQPERQASYVISVKENALSVFTGPYAGNLGPCPNGDLLESIYLKY